MDTRVLPRVSSPMAAISSCSFTGSTELVATSKMTMGASFMMARAMEMRWRSPPERLAPPSSSTVS